MGSAPRSIPDSRRTALATTACATPTRAAIAGPEIGLYVHLPWCIRKCPYCDFNSFESRTALPQSDYINALLRDLEYESANFRGREIASVYIGGGTPSLFAPAQIARLLGGIRQAADVADRAEVTLEANPGAVEAGRFIGFAEAGVNRVSIGVQSLRDRQLARLGRVHSAADARAAVTAALAAGFASVNVDVMYGLPGDTVAEGLFDLEEAIALNTPHLSWYQLALEPNTAWERRPPSGIPDDAVIEPLEARGRELLAAAGLQRYEVSAYARSGHRCAHNLNYWQFGDYVGIGAGAHSKLRLAGGAGHLRHSKQRNPQRYIRTAGTTDSFETHERVDEPGAIVIEYLMNALRLLDGTTAEAFAASTGLGTATLQAALRAARQRALVVDDAARVCATQRGLNQLNGILQTLL